MYFGLLRYTLPPFLEKVVVKYYTSHRAILLTLLDSLLDTSVNGSTVDLLQPLHYRHFVFKKMAEVYIGGVQKYNI